MKHLKFLLILALALPAGAQQKISERTTLAGASIDTAADWFPIVDTSAGTSGDKKTSLIEMWKALGGTNVSSTELGYLDGVTSAVQTQLDAKAASSHTHSLSNLTQSGATSGQVPTWNGSAWAPATPSTPTINAAAISDATTAGRTMLTAADANAQQSAMRIIQDSTQINAQSICAKRVADWVFGGGSPSARPLLVAVVGDSYATGLSLPPNCSVNGSWNLGLNSATGGATETNSNWTNWINGHTFTFPVGSQADITQGGQSGNGGYCEGDTVGIAYIKEPGAGTFALQAYSSVSASWSTIATIDTSNASKIGAYQEIALGTTNNPHYKLRVTSVTGGTVNVIAFGIWNKLAGGAMLFPYGALTGQSPTQVNSTPSAIFDPIWQGLKPDLVLACFQDGASEWVAGGSWRQFYTKAQALYTSDWMLVSPNPCNDSGNPDIYYPTYDSAAFQATITQQIDWARTAGQTWVDAYSIFGSYSEAVAKGSMLVSDVAHLTTQGINVRNADIWRRATFATLPLGGTAAWTYSQNGTSPGGQSVLRMTGRGMTCNQPFVIRSTGQWGLQIDNKSDLYSFAKSWGIDNRGGTLGFYYADPNTPAFEVTGGYVNAKYGQMHRVRSITSSTSCTYLDYTVLCDAASGNITVDVTSWPASYPGLVHIIKKTDASANTVTIDPSSTPTIDGAANVVLTAQWQYIMIQSDGTNWVKIGGN